MTGHIVRTIMNYRHDIDGLRAVAVIAVLIGHIFHDVLPNGFIGVDIFFVISGYLITRIIYEEHRTGVFSLVGFYERRVRRILPALFVVCAVTLFGAWFLFLPDELMEFGKSLLGTTLFGSNFVFKADDGYFAMESLMKPLLHTWSLAVEEQFYIVYPLFLGWLIRKRFSCPLPQILMVIIVMSFALNLYSVLTGHPRSSFYMLPMRSWELLVGAVIALYHAEGTWYGGMKWINFAGFAMLVAGFAISIPEDQFPGYYAILPVAGAGCLIYSGGPSARGKAWFSNRVLSHPIAVWFGKISYSLYLWHWPLWVLAGYASLGDLNVWGKLALLPTSILMGYLSWRFVEKPFRGKDGILTRPQLFKLAIGIGLILAVCGAALWLTKGARSKFDPDILAMNDTQTGVEYEHWSQAPVDGTFIFDANPNAPAPSVLLWGDSHALAINSVIGEIAKQNRMNGIVIKNNSCFLLPMDAAKLPEAQECAEQVQKVVDYLSVDTQLKTVIIASRWAENMKYWYKHWMTRDEAIALRRKSLKALASRLTDNGKTVIVLAQAPQILGWNEDIASVMARLKLYGLHQDLRPTVAQYHEQQADMMAIYDDLATMKNVHVVWPEKALCDDTMCKVQDEGGIYYFDDDHLSLYGASKLAPQFETLMNKEYPFSGEK